MGKFAKRRNHMQYIRITSENIDSEHICCAMSGKQSVAKKAWLKERFAEGLVFYRSEERGKCFIEYIPAESAWVPIDAPGYLYINCLWVSGAMKGHGCSNDLLEKCLRDAKAQGKKGICISDIFRRQWLKIFHSGSFRDPCETEGWKIYSPI